MAVSESVKQRASRTSEFRIDQRQRCHVDSRRQSFGRSGQMPDMNAADPGSDFHFVEREDPEKIAAVLIKLVQERIPQRFALNPTRDVQVLCPMNRGSLGVRELNTALQQILNPARSGQPSVERYGWRFHLGDKVIQTENDYDKEVFNGDIGIVERIDSVEHEVTIRFDDRLVKYDYGELDEVCWPTPSRSTRRRDLSFRQW